MRCSRFAALGCLLWAGLSTADTIEARSTTVIGGRPDLVDGQVHTVVPLIELVGLTAGSLANPVFDDLRVQVAAWGALTDLTQPGLSGDVDLAYAEGKLLQKRLRLRLGRQFMVGGAARAAYFDGLSAEYRSKLGVGMTAFAGMPVARRFGNLSHGELVVGGRLFWNPVYTAELGASIVYASDQGQVAREDVAFDARWLVARNLSLAGLASWSIAESRLAEVDVGPRWQALDNVELTAGYRRMAPDLMLPRTSILSVFADTSRDDLGGSIFYRISERAGLFGEYRALRLADERGDDFALRATYRTGRATGTTFTAQARSLKLPKNGFSQGRVGLGHRLGRGMAVSLDLEAYFLDKPIHGQTLSFTAGGTWTWALAKKWLVGVSLLGATTPSYETRYEAMAKLGYTFTTGEKD